MQIYIAASWKHEHAVVMLTERLRYAGHEVMSFIEVNYSEKVDPHGAIKNFDE